MKYVIALLLATASIEACVTVNTSTGTYTVDPSGCVNTPDIPMPEMPH